MPEPRIPTREEIMGKLSNEHDNLDCSREEFADAVILGCREGRFTWDGDLLTLVKPN